MRAEEREMNYSIDGHLENNTKIIYIYIMYHLLVSLVLDISCYSLFSMEQ